MSDEELIARWDDYVESMGSVMGEVEHMAQQMRDRIEALKGERDEATAKVDFYEQKDGMGGAVVHAIRELLNAQNVPLAAFIDDHVANAIVQRNMAEARAERLEAALREVVTCVEDGCFCSEMKMATAIDDAHAALKGADHE